MRKTVWIWAIISCLIIGSFVFAEGGSVSIQAKVDKKTIRIGDLIKYSIIVEHDENTEIQMPALGANLGAFEIRDYEDLEPEKKDGKVIHRREYVISTFETGDFEIPPVEVHYRAAGDTSWQALSTENLKITVESLKPSEEGDIRDIKPPLEIPRNWWLLIRWVLLGLAVLLAGAATFWVVKRYREGKSLIPRKEKPRRPPHEIALEELEKLKQENLLEKGEVKLFYIKISEIVRTYFEDRFFIPALEMTTGQLIEAMREAEIEEIVIEPTEKFLNLCDLAKFAKYVPSAEENQLAIDLAYQIVELTKIVIEPEEESLPAEGDGERAEAEETVEAAISDDEQKSSGKVEQEEK